MKIRLMFKEELEKGWRKCQRNEKGKRPRMKSYLMSQRGRKERR